MAYVRPHPGTGERVADEGLVGDPPYVRQGEQPGRHVPRRGCLPGRGHPRCQGLVEGAEHHGRQARLGELQQLARMREGQRGGGAVEEVALEEQGLAVEECGPGSGCPPEPRCQYESITRSPSAGAVQVRVPSLTRGVRSVTEPASRPVSLRVESAGSTRAACTARSRSR
nr:hypothetical protein StreXyl84_03430 [Streptomyces sp. Xyl84]